MRVPLAFGPLRVALTLDGDALPEGLDRHRASGREGLREVRVERVAALPEPAGADGFAGHGFAVLRGPDEDRVLVAREGPQRWVAALAAIVARDAPAAGCLVLHAGALRVEGGVALLVAPGGTGKTTFVCNAGARAFAHNAVVLRVPDAGAVEAWSLPFAGDPRPELDAAGSAAVRVVALLRRGDEPGFEWTSRSEATIPIARACVRPPGPDSMARERSVLAFALAERVFSGRLRTTRGPHDLAPLDRALIMMETHG